MNNYNDIVNANEVFFLGQYPIINGSIQTPLSSDLIMIYSLYRI